MIGIINYGMGNLASVLNALEYLNIEAKIIEDHKDFNGVDKLILPGVGAFGMAMQNLFERQLIDPIKESVLVKNKPILGICLGMQLFLTKSYEFGEHEGLNLINGEVKNFADVLVNQTIPHVGWNTVVFQQNNLMNNVPFDQAVFYFVHSYYCELKTTDQVSGTTEYGINFHSMLHHKNIFGTQFHPEKSQKAGLEIFSNFNKL